MTDQRSIEILRSHFLLSQLDASAIERLVASAVTKSYQSNEVVFLKGDPGEAMMAVLDGRIRICAYSAEGREVILNVIYPGEVFGEISLIDGKERTADAFTMEPTRLLMVHRRDFLPLMHSSTDVCLHLLQILCERLRATSEQVEDIAFRDLRSRLAKRLMVLWDARRVCSEGTTLETVRVSQHVLASMIGTSREAVNKQLRLWQDDGVITIKRGAISIRQPDVLKDIVEGL